MSFKPLILAAVATTLATPAFSQSRCAANAVFTLSQAECTQYGGAIDTASKQCTLSADQVAQARDEICLNLPQTTAAAGGISQIALVGLAVVVAAAAASGGSSSTVSTD